MSTTSKMQSLQHKSIKTPIGKLHLSFSDVGLAGVSFNKPAGFKEASVLTPTMKKALKQFEQYFAGKRKSWEIPLDWGSNNGFYLNARKACAKVGYGQTISYGELAKKAQSPRAARAVGTAMATNPISIVVPCHRVVRSGGNLGKYGGGIDRKEWLQNFESSNI